MATGLSGRVARLEAIVLPQTDHCQTCRLRHVQP
jgi:hypothetical protein